MKLLYAEEHLSCFNYEGENSLMTLIDYKAGDFVEICPKFNLVVFVVSGSVRFSYGEYMNVPAKEGDIIVHPGNYNCKVKYFSDTTILSFRLSMDLSFCNHFSFEMLSRERGEQIGGANRLHLMQANETVKSYLNGLLNYLRDGMRCHYFLELKIKEMLYIFRGYYPKEELAAFFGPMLNSDFHFSNMVYQVYSEATSVSELAKMLNYSLSGFGKRFKRVFNVSAYQWIQEQKAKNIYHEISCSNKTFTEMSFEYGFSSPSHFNDFCKKYFNATPGNIRKRYQLQLEPKSS